MTSATANTPPATLAEARERLVEAELALIALNERLNDETVVETFSPAQYDVWRVNMLRARLPLKRAVKRLKTWIANEKEQQQAAHRAAAQDAQHKRAERLAEIERQHEANRQARAARIAATQAAEAAKHQQRVERYAAATDEVRLIRDLYAALCYRYKQAGEQASEQDREMLERAHTLLVQQGLFT